MEYTETSLFTSPLWPQWQGDHIGKIHLWLSWRTLIVGWRYNYGNYIAKVAVLPKWLRYQGGCITKVAIISRFGYPLQMPARLCWDQREVMCLMYVRVVSAGQRVSAAGPGMSLILVAVIAIAVILVIVAIIIVVVTTRRWASSKHPIFV